MRLSSAHQVFIDYVANNGVTIDISKQYDAHESSRNTLWSMVFLSA